LGGPRRSDFSTYGATEQAQTWINYQLFQAIGGTILFIAIILLVYIYVKLAFFTPKGPEEFPVGEEEPEAQPTPKFYDNRYLWIGLTNATILFAYSVNTINIIINSTPIS